MPRQKKMSMRTPPVVLMSGETCSSVCRKYCSAADGASRSCVAKTVRCHASALRGRH